MSDDGGAAAPETGEQETEQTVPKTPTATQAGGGATWTDADAWRSLADELGISPDKVRAKLGYARTWEERAKANSDAATTLPSLKEELDALRQQLTARDIADVARNGQLALAKVQAELASAGVSKEDASALLEHFDPVRLLKDGHPDTKSIAAFAGSLKKFAGRPTADPDQGKGTGSRAPTDMNSLIRLAAGRGN